jgi:hypothetical protein
LRIVQQAQKRLFESLVLLGLFDLVFSFGSIFHHTMMTYLRQSSVPVPKRAKEDWRRLGPQILLKIRSVDSQKSVQMAMCAPPVSLGRLIFYALEISAARLGIKEKQVDD